VSQWFYAEGNRERRGPLSDENLVELFRSGRIALDTLVWRDGASDWQPLDSYATELGLDVAGTARAATPATPPLPPPLRHIPAGTPSKQGPAVKPGLSGCAIAGIIAVVGGVVLVAIVGILAAIALPAYQSYTVRAKASMALGQLVPLKTEVSDFVQKHDRCPVNDDEGFGAPQHYAQGDIANVRIGRFDNGHCGLEARLQVPGNSQLDGKALWLDYDPGTHAWQCRSDVDDKLLPVNCRG
jgi:type IV pilus assembly protein PilA